MSRQIIWIGVSAFLLAALFCAGFVFFYNRLQQSKAEETASSEAQEATSSKSLIDKPLPPVELIDASGVKVDERLLRKGRVVLVFVTPGCDACLAESKFLQTLLDRRKDVTFYGLIPFDKPRENSGAAQQFPFRVLYDANDSLVLSFGLNRVPVKVFLEDGIIKKGWIGAATTDKAKASFVEWLDSLPQTQ